MNLLLLLPVFGIGFYAKSINEEANRNVIANDLVVRATFKVLIIVDITWYILRQANRLFLQLTSIIEQIEDGIEKVKKYYHIFICSCQLHQALSRQNT